MNSAYLIPKIVVLDPNNISTCMTDPNASGNGTSDVFCLFLSNVACAPMTMIDSRFVIDTEKVG